MKFHKLGVPNLAFPISDRISSFCVKIGISTSYLQPQKQLIANISVNYGRAYETKD